MSLKIGYLEYTDALPSIANYYSEYKFYFERMLNISVELAPVPRQPLKEGSLDMDIYLAFVPLEKLSKWSGSHCGSIYGYDETFLISGQPVPYLRNNLAIFAVEKQILICVNLLLVSLMIMCLNAGYERFIVKQTQKLATQRKGGIKNCFASLFRQMILLGASFLIKSVPNVPKMIPVRILLSGWLISVQIFNIHVACFMKAHLSETNYQTIDNLEDFIRANSKTKLGFFSRSTEEDYVKNTREYSNLLKSNRLLEIEPYNGYLLMDDSYEELKERSVVFLIGYTYFKTVANVYLELIEEKMNFYIGKKSLLGKLRMIPVKKNLSLHISETIHFGNTLMFDTKPFGQYSIEQDRRIIWHEWEPPYTGEFQPASLNDLIVAFIILFSGYVIVCLTLFTNVTYLIKTPINKK